MVADSLLYQPKTWMEMNNRDRMSNSWHLVTESRGMYMMEVHDWRPSDMCSQAAAMMNHDVEKRSNSHEHKQQEATEYKEKDSQTYDYGDLFLQHHTNINLTLTPQCCHYCCFWSNTLEFTPIVCSWSIAVTDSVLCASEDCVILQSIRNTSIAPTWQFRL